MNQPVLELDGPWKLQGVVAGSLAAAQILQQTGAEPEWISAQVPGDVHLDLMRQGQLADPFFRDNEQKSQWVHARDWWYRKSFQVPGELLQSERIELVCDGLDTFATIFLNGQPLGTADNMFRQFRFDIRQLLRPGVNELLIGLRAPHQVLQEHHDRHGFFPGGHNHISQARKAQYSTGWDWGPNITSIGIWRSVRLEAWSGARLVSVYVRALEIQSEQAKVEVQAEVLATIAGSARLSVTILPHAGDATVATGQTQVTLTPGVNRCTLTLTVPNPRLWWPLGYGAPDRYRVEAQVAGPAFELRDTQPFGFRTIELRRQSDAEGESFIFVINGIPIFAKGANWIPADQFLSRVSTDHYRRNLEWAARAGMNMLRVWGGGIYETGAFYELCDELGIMVWQDFPFACASYPEYDEFRDNVVAEANQAIRDLRNFPSLIAWCGNNECHWAKPHGWKGFLYYDEILPRLCDELDPSRPYWAGSPYAGPGDKRPEELFGDCHSYKVWPNWATFYAYLTVRGKFLSEFAVQGPPTRPTLDQVTLPEDQRPWSAVLEVHSKQSEKFARNNRYIAAHFPLSSKFDWWLYGGNITQCLGLRLAITHWRRRKWLTAGTLIWQLNDCWPVFSWSLVDYGDRPKAGWYETRRVFAPVLLTIQIQLPPNTTELWQLHQSEPWTKLDRTIHLVNDTLTEITGTVRVRYLTFHGQAVWEKTGPAHVPPNSAALQFSVSMAELMKFDSRRHVLVAELLDEHGTVISRDLHWIGEPKHLELTANPLRVERLGTTLKLEARTLALFVEIEAGTAIPDDNYFHLLPGETQAVILTGPAEAVTVRTVNDLLQDA